MHEVLVNRLGGLSLPRKSVVRFTDRPDMTLDVYRGRKTTIQIQIHITSKTNINNGYTCAVIYKNQMLLFAIWLQFIPFRDRKNINAAIYTCLFLHLIIYV